MPTASRDRSAPCVYLTVTPPGQKVTRLLMQYDAARGLWNDPSAPELRLLSWDLEDRDRGADKLKLTLDNRNLANFDNEIWAFNGIVSFTWGYQGNMAPARQFVIRKVKGFQTLTIEAKDRAILLHRDQVVRTWKAVRFSDIARTIATEFGFRPEEIHVTGTQLVYECRQQAGLTAAQYLESMTKHLGWVWYIDDGGFYFGPRRFEQRPVRVFEWLTDPGAGDIINIDVDSDITRRPAKVTVTGRDPLKRKDITANGSNSATKRTDLAPNMMVSVDAQTSQVSVAATGDTAVKSTAAAFGAAAKQQADAGYLRGQRLAVKLKLTVVADPQVAAKQVVEVRNISRKLSGKYYIKIAHPKGDASGLVQELELITNGMQGRSAPTKGKLNTQKAPAGGSGSSLTPTVVTDARTSETKVQFKP